MVLHVGLHRLQQPKCTVLHAGIPKPQLCRQLRPHSLLSHRPAKLNYRCWHNKAWNLRAAQNDLTDINTPSEGSQGCRAPTADQSHLVTPPGIRQHARGRSWHISAWYLGAAALLAGFSALSIAAPAHAEPSPDVGPPVATVATPETRAEGSSRGQQEGTGFEASSSGNGAREEGVWDGYDAAAGSSESPETSDPLYVPPEMRGEHFGTANDYEIPARGGPIPLQYVERKGKLVERPLKTRVPDVRGMPPEFRKVYLNQDEVNDAILGGAQLPYTFWRGDKLADMTYTQFWNLIQEYKIEKVKYAGDRRSVWVTTKPTAPGGKRTERVGLPFDPDLFDHMVTHDVFIEEEPLTITEKAYASLFAALGPFFFSYWIIIIAFRIGTKRKEDRIFGGAKLNMLTGSKLRDVTFKDIAGIDAIKEDIKEIVEFLKNPDRFTTMGAKSPAGILLCGAPGVGKTLLARAIAGEAGVPFISSSSAEFSEMFVGVGASRVRNMFERARKAAPCVLFIDEFDGVGGARDAGGMTSENVSTINQLLTELDGFENNTGVIVMAATNRPNVLDKALIRAGRFDRILELPKPNTQARVEIMRVHARNKRLAPNLDWTRIARATAGWTGADLMDLMNKAATLSARENRGIIDEQDLLNTWENIEYERLGRAPGDKDLKPMTDVAAPDLLRKAIAVYEAGRALIACITPGFDELSKVTVCPKNTPTGYTFLIPNVEHLESGVTTRYYLESKMVFHMAGRCAERLVLGEGNISTAGGDDLVAANFIAREMVYRLGFSRRLGPVYMMSSPSSYMANTAPEDSSIAAIGSDLATVALQECIELVESASAKAYYGLAVNYRAFEALVTQLLVKESLTGEEVREILASHDVQPFPDASISGFQWDEAGQLEYPGVPEDYQPLAMDMAKLADEAAETAEAFAIAKSPYEVRTDYPGADTLSAEWHKNLF